MILCVIEAIHIGHVHEEGVVRQNYEAECIQKHTRGRGFQLCRHLQGIISGLQNLAGFY